MVKYQDNATLDTLFHALSDPTRRGMLERLAERNDRSVGELAEPFDITPPAVSKHLRVLERAGLVVQHKEGRVRRCHLVPEAMRAADEWIERYRVYWTEQLDALDAYLKERMSTKDQGPTPATNKDTPK